MGNRIEKVEPRKLHTHHIDLLLADFSFYFYTEPKDDRLFIINNKTKNWYEVITTIFPNSYLLETKDLPEDFYKMYLELIKATELK